MILTLVTLLLSPANAASIKNSAHDMSSGGSGTIQGPSNQLCIYCHTPHNAASTLAPLWNHITTANTAWTMYSSATLDGTKSTSPQSNSLVCLSCHDGTLDVDSALYSWATGGVLTGTTAITATSRAMLGTDLGDDHPISITYADGTDSDLHTMGTTGTTTVPLFSDRVECASCHNVHDPGTSAAGDAPFLRMSNDGSDLCLVCHNK